jgi:hypothetical protein
MINTSVYLVIFNSRTPEEPDFIDFEINEHEQDFRLLNLYKMI